MTPNSIKYIGYYATPKTSPERSIPLAGRNKMDYTINVLSRLFDKIEIVSPACLKRGEKSCKSSVEQLNSKVSLRLFSMFSNSNKLLGYINYILVQIKLFLYLVTNTKKNEPILLYHSLLTINTVLLAKRIKKFKLILELNEIYSDVTISMEKKRKDEMRIIDRADAFLFPNNLMNSMFNKNRRAYAVEYGIYSVGCKMADKFDDGKIHIIYAGTFDPAKGGAAAAAAVAAYLPEHYHVHILGFGSNEQVRLIEKSIAEVSALNKCSITYDGLLDGNDFIKFLQKCHIGLSTQNPNAKFNDTSFPSKILTYFTNGLQVVSIDIPAIKKSKLANDITFYSKQTPKAIADAILTIKDFTPHIELLTKLDNELESDLRNLFESL